jgi:hypothetical protein
MEKRASLEALVIDDPNRPGSVPLDPLRATLLNESKDSNGEGGVAKDWDLPPPTVQKPSADKNHPPVRVFNGILMR